MLENFNQIDSFVWIYLQHFVQKVVAMLIQSITS